MEMQSTDHLDADSHDSYTHGDAQHETVAIPEDEEDYLTDLEDREEEVEDDGDDDWFYDEDKERAANDDEDDEEDEDF